MHGCFEGSQGQDKKERQQWGRWAQRAAVILPVPLLLSTFVFMDEW